MRRYYGRISTPRMTIRGDLYYATRYGTGRLTPRLEQVAHGVLRGESGREIAYALGISAATVTKFKVHLFRILGVRDAIDLIIKERDGLVTVSGWRHEA